MKYRSAYYEGTKFEQITTGEVADEVWDLSMARGCVDSDRCNEHTRPSGSCAECLTHAQEMIVELASKGYMLVRTVA